ncbi:MAG: hypothetical protein ABI353_15730 [Isosphaeraceae bacterium]
MAMARRWRPQPGWIDRTGRVLGACWTLVFLMSTWMMYWFFVVDFRDAPPALPLSQMASRAQMRASQKGVRELDLKMNELLKELKQQTESSKDR